MESRPYLVQALSPLHAGTGQSVGVIDLPIARLRATNIPYVPGSSIKGVLREARRDVIPKPEWQALFGPQRVVAGAQGDEPGKDDHAGALVVGDARLLAMPVRSFHGTFALVTSPLLLELARRDLAGVPGVPGRFKRQAGTSLAYVASLENVTVARSKKCIFLEDHDLEVRVEPLVDAWARLLTRALPEEERLISERFVVVDDETMSFLMETATQVDTRVRISHDTGTVAPGQLWSEESLPAESLLLGVMGAAPSFFQGAPLSAGQVLSRALQGTSVLQLGGKATVGRGRCVVATWAETPKERRP
ncbi:type III-B CRISPR module RAMP protein Cmr4 [Myxococcus sp. K15C18031901]|uniref:type III-B CRISPR module RAMP protein Cmr4 n=1 Tax=Myxococcus dinghuensis TaxID=2906761 RepID=UPI0020A8093E|nr:type III-B CRISPR module RAMP protein Cmr4 [Myxococcus dinghuensis]MCP3103971.1 type III-B CRISPR module RAMP protein Cmr4 [Myxococcus dinghuensis]